MNQYNGPTPNNYNYGGPGNQDNNFPMNNQMGSGTSGLKRKNQNKTNHSISSNIFI